MQDVTNNSGKAIFRCFNTVRDQVNIVAFIFNMPLAFTAVLGNVLILVALRKSTSIRIPSKVLLCNLAATDLGVGTLVQPLKAVGALLEHIGIKFRIFWSIFHVVSNLFSAVSLLTMTAITIDRFLALFLGIRYKHVVTMKASIVVVLLTWLMGAVLPGMYFLDEKLFAYSITSMTGILSAVFISSCAFVAFYRKLHLHEARVRDHTQTQQESTCQQAGLNRASMIRYKKSVNSMLFVYVALLICYCPRLCFSVARHVENKPKTSDWLRLAFSFAATLVLLNSSLNPLLYCWRIREVRHITQDTIKKICCCRKKTYVINRS